MAKIPLRTYIKDIDGLIDQGLTDEAIAHCKSILQLFPKYLEVYGTLGKAYLESQRYSEASDILERILSANPDDFVSQVGLSIIREDENNLDAAIFHMERAYEIQSSNTAIQEELKRLYGRRDGITPHKIRISRGALVRMYLRGELYPQTIAEARVALQDDPNRPDIEIALAKAYAALGKDAEASEICQRLIAKLPYCLDANQIMASITENNRSSDVNPYRQKLNELDPYMEFCPSSSTNSKTVSDDSIMVDHLEWQPSMGLGQQPDWANMVGLAVESTESETTDWLNAVPSSDLSETPAPIDAAPQAPTEGNAFFETLDLAASQEPNLDWLNEISESKPDTNELPLINNVSEFPPSDELPDWLRDTPLDSSPFIQPSEASEPFEADSETNAEPDVPFSVKPEENSDWFGEFLTNQESGPIENTSTNQDQEEALPDWLLQLKNDAAPSEAAQHEEMPSWLDQPGASVQHTKADEESASPSIVPPTQVEEEVIDFTVPETASQETIDISEELPDWLKDLQKIDLPVSQDESLSTAELSIESVIAELETNPQIDETVQFEEPGILSEEFESFEAKPEQPTEATAVEFQTPVDDSMDAIEESNAVDKEFDESPSEIAPFIDESKSLTNVSDVSLVDVEASSEEMEQPAKDLEPPVWINEFEAETPASEESESTKAGNSTEDVDAAMAWLEALAANQGAAPETLVTSPEERPETPPEWVLKLKPGDAAEPTPTVADQLPEFSRDENLLEEPVENSELVIQPDEVETELPVQELEEKPDLEDLESWLRSLDEADEVLEETPEAMIEETKSVQSSETIQSHIETQPREQEPESEPDSIPEWLKLAEEELGINPSVTDDQVITSPEQLETTEPLADTIPAEELEQPENHPESTLPAWLLELEQEETASSTVSVESTPEVEAEPQLEVTTEVQTEPQPEITSELEAEPQPDFDISPPQPTSTGKPVEAPSHLPNDLPQLLEIYRQKIDQSEALDTIIDELIATSFRFPVEPSIWETLGDAYLQSGQIQNALDAYSKAEELLR
jgi:tetratricopeptide (TPR) repeat protein